MDFKARIGHLPSTLLGVASAGGVALFASLGCQVPLTDYKVWGPALLLALWGVLIKGPTKNVSAGAAKLLVLLGLVGVLSAGCATAGTGPDGQKSSLLATLQAFTQADLQAALADATTHQDKAAVHCYTTLLEYVGKPPAGKGPEIKGAFSAFQATRDVARELPALQKTLEEINLGCSALFTDANFTLLRLGVLGAGFAK